jgi:hypothetical protein
MRGKDFVLDVAFIQTGSLPYAPVAAQFGPIGWTSWSLARNLAINANGDVKLAATSRTQFPVTVHRQFQNLLFVKRSSTNSVTQLSPIMQQHLPETQARKPPAAPVLIILYLKTSPNSPLIPFKNAPISRLSFNLSTHPSTLFSSSLGFENTTSYPPLSGTNNSNTPSLSTPPSPFPGSNTNTTRTTSSRPLPSIRVPRYSSQNASSGPSSLLCASIFSAYAACAARFASICRCVVEICVRRRAHAAARSWCEVVSLWMAACISAFSADSRATSCACEVKVEERVAMRVCVLRRSSVGGVGMSVGGGVCLWLGRKGEGGMEAMGG